MKDSDSRPAPPIPPRRLKRKNKPAVNETDGVAEDAATSVIRLEHRPRLPPPPPPQRALPRRGIRPQELSAPPEVKGNTFPGSYSEEKCHPRSIIGDKLIANEIEEVRPTLSTFGTSLPLSRDNGKKPLGEEPARKKRDKGKIHRPNEYPPLFFTLQDFQDVMSDVENPYSRTLRNMTTFEPTPKPRVSKTSNQGLPDTPKSENILFRVTTTNLPFEKSLSELADAGDDPNHFIFEDYVDRRQKPAQRKTPPSNTKLILFGDDTFDREDEDRTLSTSHTASRVRFLVDSPTRNENCDKIAELDSLQNIDSLPLDISLSQDLLPEFKLTQDVDEDAFGDVPFDSLLSDPASSLCVDPSEDSTSSKTDFQTILVHATVEPIPPVGGVKGSSKNGAGTPDADVESVGEKDAPSLDKATSKVEDICEKPESPSFKKPNFNSAKECAEAEERVFIQLSEDRDGEVKTVDRIEERKKLMPDESLLDFIEVENIGDKVPSENVRRNSFLMNMLQGDEEPVAPEPEPEPEQDEGKVCKVVATHPKTPIHGSCRIDEGMEGGKRSAAVEAKSKLLGELSNSFSAIKLKPVNNFGEVEKRQSASDLKVDSMNVVVGEEGGEGKEREIVREVENRSDKDNDDENEDKDGDREAEDDRKYKLNRNLDSVLDSNVVKCKAIEEPIEELSTNKKSLTEPEDRSSVCSQKTDEIIIDKKNYVEDVDSLCHRESNKIEFLQENDASKKRSFKKINQKINVKESDINNDDDNDDNSHSTKKKNNNDNSNNNKNNNNNNNNNNNKILEVASKSSVDKCAIVLKCNNNNDNNAMTPVDISYDQSQNNVSIIPGSVRSFVKFYEIQGETSVGLNSNDITAVVPKIKVEATGDNLHQIISSSSSSKDIINSCPVTAGMEIENDIKYTIVTRKPAATVVQKQRNEVSADKKQTVNLRTDESDKSTGTISYEMLCKTNGKIEAQFSARSTLIRSKNIGENEPENIQRTIKVDAVDTSSRNNAGSDIAPGTQKGSTAGVRKDIARSGTANHSVPKSSTSTINEQCTFYCTV